MCWDDGPLPQQHVNFTTLSIHVGHFTNALYNSTEHVHSCWNRSHTTVLTLCPMRYAKPFTGPPFVCMRPWSSLMRWTDFNQRKLSKMQWHVNFIIHHGHTGSGDLKAYISAGTGNGSPAKVGRRVFRIPSTCLTKPMSREHLLCFPHQPPCIMNRCMCPIDHNVY